MKRHDPMTDLWQYDPELYLAIATRTGGINVTLTEPKGVSVDCDHVEDPYSDELALCGVYKRRAPWLAPADWHESSCQACRDAAEQRWQAAGR